MVAAPDSAETDGDTPQSSSLFYEVTMRRLDEQLGYRASSIGRAIQLFGAGTIVLPIGAGFLANDDGASDAVPWLIGVAVIAFAGLCAATLALVWPRTFDIRPHPDDLAKHSQSYPLGVMQAWVARECVTSYAANRAILERLSSMERVAIGSIALEVIALAVATMLI